MRQPTDGFFMPGHLAQFGEIRYAFEHNNLFRLPVDAVYSVIDPIRYPQNIDTYFPVVMRNLLQNLLCEHDFRGFALDQQSRFLVLSVYDHITAPVQLVNADAELRGDQTLRHIFFADQEMNDVLPHPLFRGQ